MDQRYGSDVMLQESHKATSFPLIVIRMKRFQKTAKLLNASLNLSPTSIRANFLLKKTPDRS